MTALHALARRRARRRGRRLRRALELVGRPSSRTSGPRSGTTSTSRPRRPYDAVLADRDDAGRRVVHRRRAQLRRAHLPRQGPTTRSRSCHASELRELGEITWGELRAQVAARRRRRCARSASAAATASSPTCRTSRRRSSPSSPPPASARSGRAARPTSAPRSVVDRFAQIEPKVLFAVDGYRYGGKDFDRLDDRRRRRRGDARPSSATVVVPYLSASPDLSRLEAATASRADDLGPARRAGPGRRARASSGSPSTTRSGSSTRRAPPACRRRSSRATAASCSST